MSKNAVRTTKSPHQYRTHGCAELRRENVGENVRLSGWISSRRLLGKLLFFDLSDQDGKIQVIVEEPADIEVLRHIPTFTPITIDGLVSQRPDHNSNGRLGTGDIEIVHLSHRRLFHVTPSTTSLHQSGAHLAVLQYGRSLAATRHSLEKLGFVELPQRILNLPGDHWDLASRCALVSRRHQFAMAGFDRWFAIVNGWLHVGMSFSCDQDIIDMINGLLRAIAPTHTFAWLRDFRPEHAFFAAPRGPNRVARFDLLWKDEVLGEGCAANTDLHSLKSMSAALDPMKATYQPYFEVFEKILSKGVPPHVGISINLDRILTIVHGLEPNDLWADTGDGIVTPTADWLSRVSVACDLSTSELRSRVKLLEIRDQTEIMTRLKETRSNNPASDPLQYLTPLLPDFSMSPHDVRSVLDLFPSLKPHALTKTPEAFFQFIWSLLGNHNVRSLLNSPSALLEIREFVDLGILTDYLQLVHVHSATIPNVRMLIQNGSAETPRFLRSLLARRANDFSTFVQTLAESGNAIKNVEMLMAAVQNGCVTPTLFEIYSSICANQLRVENLKSLICNTAVKVLSNVSVEPTELASSFRKGARILKFNFTARPNEFLTNELLYYIFRPVNMDFREMTHCMSMVTDIVNDLNKLDIHTEGHDWNAASACYRFPTLDIYVSKNRASFLAKASAGICTAADTKLFRRPDHFHFNLFDRASQQMIGNTQLYVLNLGEERTLLIRGINPSASYVTLANAGNIVRATVSAAVQLAAHSRIQNVCLTEPLGIWNADSARAEVRAVLEVLRSQSEVLHLDAPFPIFTFGNQVIVITKVFILWKVLS